MSKNIHGNQKHLTLSDRYYIEQSLYDHLSFRSIARTLKKDPSTISKEILRSATLHKKYYNLKNSCVHSYRCFEFTVCGDGNCVNTRCYSCSKFDCTLYCSRYTPNDCPQLKKPPYVCNGCTHMPSCKCDRKYYRAKHAQKCYDTRISDSRKGINLSPSELEALNNLVSPLIKNGQPLSHIYATHANEINCCRRTLYNYLDARILDARNIDLQRRVRYKKRRKKVSSIKSEQAYRSKRTFKDFERFVEAHPEDNIVEMDTVKGTRDTSKCLLTLLFRNSSFMIIILLPRCTQDCVVVALNKLCDTLGLRLFRKIFHVILTDNGPEFKSPNAIEQTPDGKRRSYVFYCDPYVSNQKARLEKNHEYIRYVIPKGRSMYKYTQEDINRLACHINSTARDSLNGYTPFDLADLLLDKKVPILLGLFKVSPDSVLLKPELLEK